MSSSSSSTVLGSSENSPTRTPQPDPTDDEPTVQDGANTAEHAENIAIGAQDENVRLQEQIKQLKELFKEKEQKLGEEKEAAEQDTLQAKATANTARADAGEILGAFRQLVSDSEKREKVFSDGRLDTEKKIQRAVGAAQAAAGQAETAAHSAQKALGQAQTMAGEAQTEVRTTTGEAQKAIRTAVDQAKRDQETAKKHRLETRHKWFFWIMLALVANALLWTSMLFGISRIEDWSSQRPMYLFRVWMIFTAPLVVVMMLLFSPCLSNVKDFVCHRYLDVEPWDFGILLINAAACFALVVVYLYASAIPRYHHPVFESGVDFVDPLRWPTMAFIVDSRVSVTVSPAECTTGANQTSCFPGALSQDNSSPETLMFVFNASLLSPEQRAVHNLAMEVSIAFEIIHNSSDSTPAWLIYIADPRMSLDNTVTCGFVSYQTSPMLTDADISLTMETLHDELNSIGSTFASLSEPYQYLPGCELGLRELLSAQEPFYSLYTASITSSDSNLNCNTAAVSDQHMCHFVYITLSFGSRIVRTTQTKPGISKQDIWLNAGAIVGAVQFFAWLLRGG